MRCPYRLTPPLGWWDWKTLDIIKQCFQKLHSIVVPSTKQIGKIMKSLYFFSNFKDNGHYQRIVRRNCQQIVLNTVLQPLEFDKYCFHSQNYAENLGDAYFFNNSNFKHVSYQFCRTSYCFSVSNVIFGNFHALFLEKNIFF